ncbi:hypothetical protein LCGC14_2639740, partial [marine sediment metagenome]
PSSSAHSYLDPTRKTWRFSVLVTAIGKAEVLKACDVAQAAKLLVEKLKSDIYNAYSLRLKELNEEQKKLQGMTSDSRKRLEKLLHEGESKGLFPENFELIIKRGARLESMQEDLRVALAGKRARKKALASEIPRLTTVAREKTAADPVTRELEKIVVLQKEQLQKVREMTKERRAAVVSDLEVAQRMIKTRLKDIDRAIFYTEKVWNRVRRQDYFYPDRASVFLNDRAHIEKRLDRLRKKQA